MAMLIGVDEAGYGPNLGPLVVAATAWEIDECGIRNAECGINAKNSAFRNPHSAIPNLYTLLRRGVARTPGGPCVAIADSKALYKPAIGLTHLEHGVLAALRCITHSHPFPSPSPLRGGVRGGNGRPHPSPPPRGEGTVPRQSRGLSWLSLVETLCADAGQRQRELPWHDGFDCDVPCTDLNGQVDKSAVRLEKTMDSARVRLAGIRARLVFPAEFNELVEQYGNKAAALSEVTMRLVREVVGSRQKAEGSKVVGSRQKAEGSEDQNELPASPTLPSAYCPLPTFVLCDKHGGRNHYAALVQQHFPETWVETLHESRAASWYRTRGDAPLSFCFRMEGEAFLPAALASMTAKYLRELAMRAFNEFWCQRVPELRPTAGYPGDAKRFRADIAHEQRRLGIADRLLWRER